MNALDDISIAVHNIADLLDDADATKFGDLPPLLDKAAKQAAAALRMIEALRDKQRMEGDN